MTVCANRTDEPGFFTSCVLAAGKCRCGESVRAEDAAAASDATPPTVAATEGSDHG